jgi:hypothetical protein
MLKRHDPSNRAYAERAARAASRAHNQPYIVFRGGTDTPDIWLWSPLGDRRDPGPYVRGCVSYTVRA